MNEKAVQEYVRNQEKEDMLYEQISIKEYLAPFDPDKTTKISPRNNGRCKCRN